MIKKRKTDEGERDMQALFQAIEGRKMRVQGLYDMS